jgi:hypothetical protein
MPLEIDFDVPSEYIEWHVIDRVSQRSIERCDEPDHALTHGSVIAGTAYVVEATVQSHIIKHRIVTEDNIWEE